MSVYADGLMKKAHTQMKNNYKETGIYETNIQINQTVNSKSLKINFS